MRALAIPLAVLMTAASVAAQEDARPAKAQVLVLATYHFHNPGADVAQFTVADHLAEPRQREIAALVDALARFRPTKILLEWTPDTADTVAATYARYRAGSFALTANEVHQIGFRLGARLGHDALYPVDHRMGLPIDSMMAYAQANDPRFVERFGALIREVEGIMARWQRENTVGETLREMNSPEMLERALQPYLDFAVVGAGDNYIGARVASAWYARNLHIFANMQRVIQPGDRVLFVVGQGHAPLINHFVRMHPGMELADPLAYLP